LILDSSAVVAILRREQGHDELEDVMQGAPKLAMGAPTLFETGMVAGSRLGVGGQELVGRFIEDWQVEIVPFGERHSREALDAFNRYGKGRHPARLNYGDCMTYATATVAKTSLLYVGKDFARTDVIPA
jgi:ribonuclease VapC